jgi:histidinol dehydrogenase
LRDRLLAGPTESSFLATQDDPTSSRLTNAQAEHDTATLPIFITTSKPLARGVSQILSKVRDNVAAQALRRNGAILLADTRQEAIAWANRIAAEHVTVEKRDLPLIRNAGSIFVGDYSAQAAGDYAAGRITFADRWSCAFPRRSQRE